jgi:hypothetical protein
LDGALDNVLYRIPGYFPFLFIKDRSGRLIDNIQGVRKRLYIFFYFFFGPLLFGVRHLENFGPTGAAGISSKSREYLVAISATYTTLHTLGT